MKLSRRQQIDGYRKLIRDFRQLEAERHRRERQDALRKLGQYLDQARRASTT